MRLLLSGKVCKRGVVRWSQALTMPVCFPLPQLQTFHVLPPCTSPQDLSSGLAIASVLNQM